ncbi:MAG: DUF177 domain-containing protein [Chitinophagaceae bacterium]|nr:DUF177 domain-containing protein [Chitinophagaceae bacterium]
MANKRAFEIAFVGLKPGIHEFNYVVDDKFFVEKGATDINNIKANVKLLLDKKTGFMLLKFEIGGTANVICDRCGNTISQDLWDEFNMVVKLVENAEEMNDQEEDPDVFYLPRTESHLQIAGWIYEFVLLSVPMQRMCKIEEVGGPQCNKEVLEKLKSMQIKDFDNNANDIWKGLDQFKNKKKKE